MMRSGKFIKKQRMMKFNKRKIHTLIEYQYNKLTKQFDEVTDEFYIYKNEVALAGGVPTREWTDWAFYDDGTEAGSVIIGTKNTNPVAGLDVDTIYFFRVGVEETAAAKWNNPQIQLEFNLNSTGWVAVSTTAQAIQATNSANVVDSDDTTQRMTSFTFEAANNGIVEDGLSLTSTDPELSGLEILFVFQIPSGQVADNDSIELRLWDAGNSDTLDLVNQTNPTFIVNEGTTPQNYERVLTSEIDAQDQQQAYENKLRHLLSSMNLNDSIISEVSVAPILRTLGSSLNVSDEIKTTALRFSALASSLNVQDNSIAGELLARTLLSSLDANDALIRTIAYYVSLVERTLGSGVDVSDGDLTRLQDINYTAANNINANDNLIRTIDAASAVVERFLSSNLNINDELIEQVLAIRLATDNIELFDLLIREISGGAIISRTLLSFVATNDSLSRDALLFRLLISSADANDTTLIEKLLLRALNDNTDISDAIISLVQGIIVNRVLTSKLNVFDALLLVSNLTKLLTEIVNINDVVVESALLNRTVNDEVSLYDFIISGAATIVNRLLHSSLVIEDEALLTKHLTKVLASTIPLIDNLLQDKNISRLLVDNTDILDAVISAIYTAPQGYIRTLTDNVDVQDAILKEVLNLLRGYILMHIKDSEIETSIERSNIIIDTKATSIDIGTKE